MEVKNDYIVVKSDYIVCPRCGNEDYHDSIWVWDFNHETTFDGWISAYCTCDACKAEFTAVFKCSECCFERDCDDDEQAGGSHV